MKNKSISFLLGAGFSANQGYPVGETLNNLLLSCKGEDFFFHSMGGLGIVTEGQRPLRTSYDHNFEFCKELIQYFNFSRGHFDYEEFYDFILIEAKQDPEVEKIAQKYYGSYFSSVYDLLYGITNILNQLLGYYLKDRDGLGYYDDQAYVIGDYFDGYTGILRCIKEFSSQFKLHIHTLNHDLLVERFNHTEFFAGKLTDGFEELGSPYYGELRTNGRAYKCRMEHYTGNYDREICLYKLHGSRDYGVYHGSEGAIMTPENYVKTRWGIGFSEFYKEKIVDGKLTYERDFVNYHGDFLTGTTSKIERYKEPLLYKKLFELFKQNLVDSELLIIIGYGAKDSEINKILLENFDFNKKKCFIIDLYPSDKVVQLQKALNAKLIVKDLNEITIKDITA